jgi:CheY-like chemotaxis protein
VPDDRPLLARRLRLGHLIAVDAVGAAVLLIAHTSFSQVDDSQPQFEGPFWFVVFIAAVISLPVAVRRLWPEAALAVSQTRRRSVAALMVCGAVVVISVGINAITTFQDYWTGPVGLLAFVAMMLVVAWTSGAAVREHREYAIRSAEQLARNAVGDERLRIARELHDVVAHSMSLIAVKAGIANHVADQRPQEARDALRVIEQTSRGTLNEMRRMLGVLRSETDEASLAPIPGLAGLPELRSTQVHAPTAGSACSPGCRTRRCRERHQGAGRRRSGTAARQFPGADRHRARSDHGRRADNGAQAVALSGSERPDVVLMDVRMPEMDGIEATRRICGSPETAHVRVLMLTTFELDAYVYAALRAGASGFLLKDTPPTDLLAAIRVIADGESLLSPSVTRRLIAEFASRPRTVPADRARAVRCHRTGTREPGDREDARRTAAGQVAGPRPRATGHRGLRDRPGVRPPITWEHG